MKNRTILLLSCFAFFVMFNQVIASDIEDLKSRAKKAFQSEQYPRALEYLHQAERLDSTDAEVYFLLGYYFHYLCYDSRPLSDYSRDDSDQVIRYLQKAVALDSSLGNAFYFLGVEYGARVRTGMHHENYSRMRAESQQGVDSGGYPPWLLEYNQNILRSVPEEAILFVGGDAEATPLLYLQAVKRMRTDVSIIAILRGDELLPNPDPDTVFHRGDRLGTLATAEEEEAFERLLRDGFNKQDVTKK